MDKIMEEAKRYDEVSIAIDVIAKNLKTDRVSLCSSVTYDKFLEALIVIKHISLLRKARDGKSERLASILEILHEEILDQAKQLEQYVCEYKD